MRFWDYSGSTPVGSHAWVEHILPRTQMIRPPSGGFVPEEDDSVLWNTCVGGSLKNS